MLGLIQTGLEFQSCVWREVSSHSSRHPQEVLLAHFSLYVHKGGLKPYSLIYSHHCVYALRAQYHCESFSHLMYWSDLRKIANKLIPRYYVNGVGPFAYSTLHLDNQQISYATIQFAFTVRFAFLCRVVFIVFLCEWVIAMIDRKCHVSSE